MERSVKGFVALLLAAILLLGAAGCVSENNTWSAKYDGETLPIGVYIYYLSSAIKDAQELTEDKETSVLKQTIEGKDAETWIREKADYYTAYYFAAQKQMKDRGLSLDEADLRNAEAAASSYWAQLSTDMTEFGISYESFKKVITLQYQVDKVFRSVYLEGGEKEMPEEEIRTYFEENYVNYSYAPAYMYYYDEQNSYHLLTEDEQAALKEAIQGVLDQYNSGKMTREELEEELAKEEYHTSSGTASETEFQFYTSVSKNNPDSVVGEALATLEDGQAGLADSGSGLVYVLIREDIREETDNYMADESKRYSLVAEAKGDEFSDYMEEQALALQGDIVMNESLLKKQRLSKFMK